MESVGNFLFGFLTIQNAITLIITATSMYLYQVYSGASGKYLADKYTDQRRQSEEASARRRLFGELYREMRVLLDPIKLHLREHPESRKLMFAPAMIELQILSTMNAVIYETKDRKQHDIVGNWILRLSEHNFIGLPYDDSNTQKIILKDELVAFLQKP